MAAPLEGGTDWNAAIQGSREEIKSNRKALLIMRKRITDAILLNKENADLVVFLSELMAGLDTVVAGEDEIRYLPRKTVAIRRSPEIETQKGTP